MTAMQATRQLLDEQPILFPLNVGQYHRMIKTGILPEGEPYELIHGLLLRKDRSAVGEDPMTVGLGHALIVQRLAGLDSRIARLGFHVRTQQPITLPPNDEPESDAVIAVGTAEDYRDHHPGRSEVLCVFEVADASLRRDRATKLPIYAVASIPMYVIINLPGAMVEVYRKPVSRSRKYAETIVMRPGQTVVIPLGGKKMLRLPVRKLLP